MKIGFIGLGIMGTPMAQHLLNAPHDLYVRTRSQVPAVLSAASVCATNAAAASGRPTFSCLNSSADSRGMSAVSSCALANEGVAAT